MKNLSHNLKILRKNANLSQESFSKILNISRQTLSYYECGTREPDLNTLINISKFFNCSIDFLVTGNTSEIVEKVAVSLLNKDTFSKENLISDLKKKRLTFENSINEIDKILVLLEEKSNTNSECSKVEFSEELTPSNIINFNKYKDNHSIDLDFYNENNVRISKAYFNQSNDDISKKFPVYGNISCGALKLTDDSIEDYFYIDKNSLKYNDNDYFILRVDGDSMNKLYKNGDYLLIRKTQSFDSHHQPYVFMVDDEATLKFISIDEDNLKLIPHSTKSCYDIKNITFDELKYMNSNIIGTVESVLDFQD